ncbi:hypothetical protein HDZ31DRAFT_80203 [Schizophyllum fasciatum]
MSTLKIYATIVSHVRSRSDLTRLCLVSRGFKQAARYSLYNTLSITVGPRTEENMLLRTLATTPETTRVVNALSIRLLPNAATGILACALRTAERLQFLEITGGTLPPASGEPPPSTVLEGVRFQLKSLTCDVRPDLDLAKFLDAQRELEDLTLTGGHAAYDKDIHSGQTAMGAISPGALPMLRSLECDARLAAILVPGRCIHRLHAWVEDDGDYPALTRALRATASGPVSLEVLCPDDAAALSLLGAASSEARYLGTLSLPVDSIVRLKAYGLLFRLSQIETLAIDISCWNPPPASHRALRAIACEIAIYARALRRVAFNGPAAWRGSGALPNAGRSRRCISRAYSSPFPSRAPSPRLTSRPSSPWLISRPASSQPGPYNHGPHSDGFESDEGDAIVLSLVDGLWILDEDAMPEYLWRET